MKNLYLLSKCIALCNFTAFYVTTPTGILYSCQTRIYLSHIYAHCEDWCLGGEYLFQERLMLKTLYTFKKNYSLRSGWLSTNLQNHRQLFLIEEIAHNTTCWWLFCTKPHIELVFAPNTIFSCNCCKKHKVIITLFNSKLGDQFTTPDPSPNQLEHTKSIGTYRSLEATIYIIYLYISDKI
jgi:hypothetical protein